YAWYTKNSLDRGMLPVGSEKPNDFGLFDMLGNGLEWCQDPMSNYQVGRGGYPVEDREFVGTVLEVQSRILRGGSFVAPAMRNRSAHRTRLAPSYLNNYHSFRVARTCR